ncbi:hypothetical protein ALIPUT_01001 [Alistipes putredinis DSM 17216]|uniref:Uncharacterized protein n=1 Tax=Alistipes putredinis DSM 17216 TaxID=445970 RepID=B0MV61_9BACT|nr:hypothetical protein ALIPUT_01001 [Alistipes putredinis DSM 17216]
MKRNYIYLRIIASYEYYFSGTIPFDVKNGGSSASVLFKIQYSINKNFQLYKKMRTKCGHISQNKNLK